MMREGRGAWMHVTAGEGPAECAWAAAEIARRILEEAASRGIDARVLESVPGEQAGTVRSVLLAVAPAPELGAFLASWRGTVQWTARSPYRPEHRRKNWFVSVRVLEEPEAAAGGSGEVRVETMRASGAGGQHVNRTESAVRVTHVPTGVQAVASEERSQHANRRLALARLAEKLRDLAAEREAERGRAIWKGHRELERGNPVRTFKG